MSIKNKRRSLLPLLIMIGLIAFGARFVTNPNGQSQDSTAIEQNQTDQSLARLDSAQAAQLEQYKVDKVVDGDTLVVRKVLSEGKLDSRQRLRLIGLDSPESVHPEAERNTPAGEKASEFSKQALKNQFVLIEFDQQRTDRYERLLAYVWLEDVLYNQVLVYQGHAKAKHYPPNLKYQDLLDQAQVSAKTAKRGMWESE